MDCKGPKQKLQCYEDSEKESKRPRIDDDGDEVEQFFALVDRIQAMHALFKQKRMDYMSAEQISSMEEYMGANVIARGSPWKPSFAREDFFGPPSKDSSSIKSDVTFGTNRNPISSGVSQKADFGRDTHMVVESFDLNVEPTT